MSPLDRRTFLRGAAVVGTALGLDALPAGEHTTASAASGSITDVKHVVILMQENRSFDHYFGALKGVRGFADRSTITLPGGHSVFSQPSGSGRQYPWSMSATSPWLGVDGERLAQCDGSLDHGWSSQHKAWNNGKMDSWVSAKGTNRTMGFLKRGDIPFHYALADAYTICDAYHCSILSATGPNRTYLWGGMIDPDGTAGGPAYDGADESGLKWQTYAESLQNAGVSWKVYQNAGDNFGDNGLAYFSVFENASAGNPLYDRGMASVPRTSGSTPDDIAAAIRHDVLNGSLPQVSWIVANQGFSEHPSAPPNDGAHFINLVMQALNADPAVFNSTVMFINYDENDGFFDHVPPPVPPAGTPDEFVNGTPIGLGFRVPMFVISPWSRGGWVNSQVTDHTSVIQFMEAWTTALGTPARCSSISAWRRKVTGDLTGCFDFGSPVYGMPSLPSTSAVIGQINCYLLPNPSANTNALPVQETGTKPARALPYQPNAYISRFDYNANGQVLVWVDMANQGVQAGEAVHFSVYANAYRSGGPWQYTVDPYNAATRTDGQAEDYFNVGSGYGNGLYDLSVVGPNRFLRRFTGNALGPAKNIEVGCYYAPAPTTGKQAVWFRMTNQTAASVTFTIKSNNYRSDGPWTYQVAAGEFTDDFFNAVAYQGGWYDFTVTVSADGSFSRRFVGHIETGAPSVTG
ncbi:phosphocholine-specific phospholipase C [Streptomyces glomeratus]|uniref:phospholipase C n=1 Tax=Streptomyces glomeratus TaxID=284452 RepID=A0ABP6LQX6_9ACTN|nr:phospholipase C, phosphocholine-specific [Streptomyces glomeratus]MCF1509780.1 phospholipase C, phosphocholine-specific [Streptomyces glomeratus]